MDSHITDKNNDTDEEGVNIHRRLQPSASMQLNSTNHKNTYRRKYPKINLKVTCANNFTHGALNVDLYHGQKYPLLCDECNGSFINDAVCHYCYTCRNTNDKPEQSYDICPSCLLVAAKENTVGGRDIDDEVLKETYMKKFKARIDKCCRDKGVAAPAIWNAVEIISKRSAETNFYMGQIYRASVNAHTNDLLSKIHNLSNHSPEPIDMDICVGLVNQDDNPRFYKWNKSFPDVHWFQNGDYRCHCEDNVDVKAFYQQPGQHYIGAGCVLYYSTDDKTWDKCLVTYVSTPQEIASGHTPFYISTKDYPNIHISENVKLKWMIGYDEIFQLTESKFLPSYLILSDNNNKNNNNDHNHNHNNKCSNYQDFCQRRDCQHNLSNESAFSCTECNLWYCSNHFVHCKDICISCVEMFYDQ